MTVRARLDRGAAALDLFGEPDGRVVVQFREGRVSVRDDGEPVRIRDDGGEPFQVFVIDGSGLVGAGVVTVQGGTGNDQVSVTGARFEVLGGEGDDFINGGNLADVLRGGANNDTLDGRGGKDLLDGGRDTDQLTGGLGPDSFLFGGQYGTDTVKDFEDNIDTLLFRSNSLDVSKKSEVLDHATVDGGDVVFDFGNGDKLIVEGIDSLRALRDDIDLV